MGFLKSSEFVLWPTKKQQLSYLKQQASNDRNVKTGGTCGKWASREFFFFFIPNFCPWGPWFAYFSHVSKWLRGWSLTLETERKKEIIKILYLLWTAWILTDSNIQEMLWTRRRINVLLNITEKAEAERSWVCISFQIWNPSRLFSTANQKPNINIRFLYPSHHNNIFHINLQGWLEWRETNFFFFIISALDRKNKQMQSSERKLIFFPPGASYCMLFVVFWGVRIAGKKKITVGLRELLNLNFKSFSVLREEEWKMKECKKGI